MESTVTTPLTLRTLAIRLFATVKEKIYKRKVNWLSKYWIIYFQI